MDDRAVIEALVRGLDDAWIAGRIEDLGDYFDEEAVLVAPGGAHRVVGRAAVVESYRQYVEMARTLAFEVTELAIDVFGATAVARLAFRIRYRVGEVESDESGADMLVLAKREGSSSIGAKSRMSWRIVWRTRISAQEQGPEG